RLLPAGLVSGRDDAHGAPEKLLTTLPWVGGHGVRVIIDRLASPIAPHRDVKSRWEPSRIAGRTAGGGARHRKSDDHLLGAILLGDLGERRGVSGARLRCINGGDIASIAERHLEARRTGPGGGPWRLLRP